MSDLLKVCADNLVNQGVFSGVLWRVDQNSTPMFCGRSGTRDVSTGAFIPENPVFRVYSMTKPIVSVLALKLVETGFLRLNTPLAELDQRFSKMRVLGADGHLAPADGLITIEHLLTHRE